MTLESDLNARVFQAEVAHRLHHVWEYLRDSRTGQRPSVMLPLRNVHALQDECLQLGHTDLAELCAWMERAIMDLHVRDDSDNEESMADIATACTRIASRAHAEVEGPCSPVAQLPELVKADAA